MERRIFCSFARNWSGIYVSSQYLSCCENWLDQFEQIQGRFFNVIKLLIISNIIFINCGSENAINSTLVGVDNDELCMYEILGTT